MYTEYGVTIRCVRKDQTSAVSFLGCYSNSEVYSGYLWTWLFVCLSDFLSDVEI